MDDQYVTCAVGIQWELRAWNWLRHHGCPVGDLRSGHLMGTNRMEQADPSCLSVMNIQST